MSSSTTQMTPRLSICITTFNRCQFIGATLESILSQADERCEVVVFDGGSTDDTEKVVSDYASRYRCLRYIKQQVNHGFDHDCNSAVEHAAGEYCWLMPDDDLFKPGAIETVFGVLEKQPSLVIVNIEFRDFAMSRVLQRRWLSIESDREYGPNDLDNVAREAGGMVRYIGCLIVKRELWLAREQKRFWGSLFAYIAAIFQKPLPGPTILIADPQISYRMGNVHTFSTEMYETFVVKLHAVVAALDLSEPARRAICDPEPWKNLSELLLWRAQGFYSLVEYNRWIRPHLNTRRERVAPFMIAAIPGVIVTSLFYVYYSVTRRWHQGMWQPELVLQEMRDSRFHPKNRYLFRGAAVHQ
jgi:abequosyltransferase